MSRGIQSVGGAGRLRCQRVLRPNQGTQKLKRGWSLGSGLGEAWGFRKTLGRSLVHMVTPEPPPKKVTERVWLHGGGAQGAGSGEVPWKI